MYHNTMHRRLRILREKLRDDPQQTKALSHVLKLFLIMLILTLIARGTAAATMAQVELGSPVQHTITHSFQTSGTITPLHQTMVCVPAGLVVAELPVQEGAPVEQGAVLVRFRAQELDNSLLRKEAQLQQMAIQLETLLDHQEVSSDGVTSAQTRQQRAQTALEEAQNRLSQEQNHLTQARQALETAQANLDALLENADATDPETDNTQPPQQPIWR